MIITIMVKAWLIINNNIYSKNLIISQKNFEKLKNECLKLESVIHPSKEAICEKEKETFMMLDQIQQMYLLLCDRNGEQPIYKREQVEEQLDYIKTEIEKIQEVIALSEEMMANEDRSDIAECGSGKSGKPRK